MDLDALPPVVDDATARAYAAFRARPEEPRFDPYYSEEVARFQCRKDDVLVLPRDAQAQPAGCGALLVSTQAHARIEVCGVSPTAAARVLAAIDGMRTAEEVEGAAGVDASTWEQIMRAAFGTVLFAPSAVAELEQRVSGTEIVRFVGSPYEIVRAYWDNMATVAARLRDLSAALSTADAFVRLMRELHVLALAGESGRSFYRPASPIFEKESEGLGEFLRSASVTEETSQGTRFVSGPRVGAGLIGGPHYHALLTESASDPGALAPARLIEDEAGLSWGRIVTARAVQDEREAPWFCPPRPLSPLHFETLRAHLVDALRAEPSRSVGALAGFHWAFVRAHPFAFANQCVAMSVVNHVLRQTLGAGMPHHVLDHLALRLSKPAYEGVFRIAVRAWVVHEDSPVRRTLELVARKRRTFELLRKLDAAPSVNEARRLAGESPEDANLVLLNASSTA